MATLVQRAIQAEAAGDESFGISDEEKEQLLAEINKIHDKK